jgi:hypothetical protein
MFQCPKCLERFDVIKNWNLLTPYQVLTIKQTNWRNLINEKLPEM